MERTRSAGILLPVFSLPNQYGCGGFGAESLQWIDRVSAHGLKAWQILPLGYHPSEIAPYSATSSFAKHAAYLDPAGLVEMGLLTAQETVPPDTVRSQFVSRPVTAWKLGLAERAYARYQSSSTYHAEFAAFVRSQFEWVYDFAAYEALRIRYRRAPWQTWPGRCADGRDFLAMERAMFLQFLLDRQWQAVRRYANERGVAIIGDLPFYSAAQGADAWAHKEGYDFRRVSGYPADAVFTNGQVWGTPVYDWKALKKERYRWPVWRIAQQLRDFDVVRLDHYYGLFRFWSFPAVDGVRVEDAEGRWNRGPGTGFLEELAGRVDMGRLVMENMGGTVVRANRAIREMGSSGIRVAVGDMLDGRPFNRIKEATVVYSSTHDFPTLASLAGKEETDRWLSTVLDSPGWLAVMPLQDILRKGNDARINVPGTPASANWRWRFSWDEFDERRFEWLRDEMRRSGR